MKKIILSLLATAVFCLGINAQEKDKYTRTMETNVPAVDTVRNSTQLIALSATFERIAEAEKTKWLPYYYAALTQVNAAYFMGTDIKAEKTDPMADKAEAFIGKADALSPKNSEIYLVKKMIASLRLMGDPMNRYMQYGPIAEEAIQTAIKLDPENPRIYLLQAQDKYYTPEQFGGSKTEAKELFQTAQKKYMAFKPASSIDPAWGQPAVQYFLAELSK
jgi:hypothetical protein